MSNDRIAAVFLFTAMAVLVGVDIGFDLQSGETLSHVVVEGSVFFLSLGGLFCAAKSYRAIQRQNRELEGALHRSRADALAWKKESDRYIKGLGMAIESQLQQWGLTAAEKEIGLLILKGFSFKEISSFRKTSERTTRQQSLEIYRKAGLSGRAEFSAFFLEDLLLPKEEESQQE